MSVFCDVEIEKPLDRPFFTTGDFVRGRVWVTVPASVSLESIVIKIEGIAKSQLEVKVGDEVFSRIPRRRRARDDETQSLLDTHAFFYQSQEVFPPLNVRKVLQAKEFTLAAGKYDYPFEFQIPWSSCCTKKKGLTNKVDYTNGQWFYKNKNVQVGGLFGAVHLATKGAYKVLTLPSKMSSLTEVQQSSAGECQELAPLPPSLSGLDPHASVSYFIKATARRASAFRTNIRKMEPFLFAPLVTSPPPTPPLSYYGNIMSSGRPHGRVQVQLPNLARIVAGDRPPFTMLVQLYHPPSPQSRTFLQSLHVSLTEVTVALVREDLGQGVNNVYRSAVDSLLVIGDFKFRNLELEACEGGSDMRVDPRCYANCIVPLETVPSFTACNVERSYVLQFTVGISFEALLKHNGKVAHETSFVVIDTPVVILRGNNLMPSLPSEMDHKLGLESASSSKIQPGDGSVASSSGLPSYTEATGSSK